MKSILSGVLLTISLLLCGTVSADNFWVLGSYQKQSAANDRARLLESVLGVRIQQQSAEVNGVTHHRLLASETNLDGERDQRLLKLGVTPWLITLKSSSSQSSSSRIQFVTTRFVSNQCQPDTTGARLWIPTDSRRCV